MSSHGEVADLIVAGAMVAVEQGQQRRHGRMMPMWKGLTKQRLNRVWRLLTKKNSNEPMMLMEQSTECRKSASSRPKGAGF